LDLIEILIKCPDNEERIEKIETIRTLFINIHHLINEYRPVQARDTLRQLIKHQNLEITVKFFEFFSLKIGSCLVSCD